MKYVEEYLETVVKVKPLGELTTREDILYDMSGEMVYIDGKCSDIFISHADYANWLEKQRQNPAEWHREDEQNLNACLGYIPDEFLRKWLTDIIHVKYDKPADMIEPKFKIGDWVVSSVLGTAHIIDVNDSNEYQLEYIDDKQKFSSIDYVNYEYNEWTIQDAKDGDVLDANGAPFIYKRHDKDYVYFYCGINLEGEFIEANGIDTWNNNNKVYPATKEQRDLLFQKMKEEGYKWDAEKKELKKISQRMISAEAKEVMYDKPTDNDMVEALRTEYEKGRADAIAEMQKEWSEEDKDFMYDTLSNLTELKDRYGEGYGNVGKCIDWLKSLKQRIGG